MSQINISLPESIQEFVSTQVKEKGYGTATEYVIELIRKEQEKEEQKRLENLLIEGLDSGELIELNDGWWEEKRQKLSF